MARWSRVCESFVFLVESNNLGHRSRVPSQKILKELVYAIIRDIGTYQVSHLFLGLGDLGEVSYKCYQSLNFARLGKKSNITTHSG